MPANDRLIAVAPRRRPAAEVPLSDPSLIAVGETLCRLRVWSEREWEALPERERPTLRTYAEGLGWVAAVPLEGPRYAD